LSFPRKWESILHPVIWIPVLTRMTHKSLLVKQHPYLIVNIVEKNN